MSATFIGSHSPRVLPIGNGVSYHLGMHAAALVPAIRIVGDPERIAPRALAASSRAPQRA
jgi:hypothetical protein